MRRINWSAVAISVVITILWLSCRSANGQQLAPIPIEHLPEPDVVGLTSLSDSEVTLAARLSEAVCKVSVSGAAGSGTLIAQDDKSAVVLTAEHVTGRSGVATCTFRDGTQRQGRIYATQDGIDAAVIFIAPVSARPVPIAKQDPPVGANVLALGYGGGWKTLWAASTKFTGTETWQGGYGERFLTRPIVFISGDSGGLLSYNGNLVGVIEGYGSTHGHGPNVRSIRTFLAQWWPDACPQCPPPRHEIPRTPQQRPDRIPVPPSPPPIDPKPEPCPQIDYDKLLDLLAKDERFRGPPGKDGEPGNDGGKPEIDLEAVADILASKHADKLRGLPGKDGATGPPGNDGEAGYVTVRIVTETGEELYRLDNLKPNTEVDLPLRMRKR